MSKLIRILSLISICILCFLTFATLSKTQNIQFSPVTSIPDNALYAYIFSAMNGFNNKSESLKDEKNKEFFQNYFKRKANLDEKQAERLISIATNFNDAYSTADQERKINLSLNYRDTLKKEFGEIEFNRFDNFLRTTVVPGLKLSQSENILAGGASYADINQQSHTLTGSSITFVFQLTPSAQQVFPCSVTVLLSGPGVSETATSSQENCMSNPTASVMTVNYQSNAQYCANGSHSTGGSSQDCENSPETPRVTNVSYEQILTDDLPIDANPADNNTATADGLRIFPDKKLPAETVDRRKVRVKAQYYQATSGVRIYFRNLDLDDPSANSAPLDVESTVNAGNDNNGTVDGTAPTKAGKLSVPSPNPNNCQTWADGVSCETNASGLATVDFTVTKQPGDNFAVVAGADDTYISALTLMSDGINLKDTNNARIPVTTTANNSCSTGSVSACRADMLTVWRRLHIEKDKMGAVTGNKVTGQINGTVVVPRATSLNPGTATVNLPTTFTLDTNQYWFGRLEVGADSFKVTSNTANTVTVENTSPRAVTINNGADFILYDDDDYNDNDGFNFRGDDGEPMSEFSNSFQHMQDADGNYGDNTPRNVFSSAYIKPEYAWASSYNNLVPFDLNVTDAEVQGTASTSLMNANRGSKNDENDDFWIAYLIFGYQPATNEDFDPAGEGLVVGKSPGPTCDCYLSSVCPRSSSTTTVVCGANIPAGTQGSVIFLETSTDSKKFWANPQQTAPTFPIPPKVFNEAETTVPHEVGHQFGLLGDQTSTLFKIMDYQDPISSSGNVAVAFHPEHINIMRKRIHSPGI